VDFDLEQRLAEFVDREEELGQFMRMMSRMQGTKRVFLVLGDGGSGKSSLMARMYHEVSLAKVRKTLVVWTDTRNHDYLAVMRHMRDDLGVDRFSTFTDLVNYFTVPAYNLKIDVQAQGSISAGQNLVVTSNSSVGDVSGVLIRDMMVVLPRQDMQVPETERVVRLTKAFLSDLQALSGGEPVVVFFDAIEKMTEATRSWVWGELLSVMREPRFDNVLFVLLGREAPAAAQSRDWHRSLEPAQLSPLGLKETMDYLEVRGVPETLREGVAQGWLAATKGKALPLELANMVDALLARLRGRQ
jgi:hypothetical protein